MSIEQDGNVYFVPLDREDLRNMEVLRAQDPSRWKDREMDLWCAARDMNTDPAVVRKREMIRKVYSMP